MKSQANQIEKVLILYKSVGSDTQSKDVRSRINTMKSLKINEKSNLNDASSESFSLNNVSLLLTL